MNKYCKFIKLYESCVNIQIYINKIEFLNI